MSSNVKSVPGLKITPVTKPRILSYNKMLLTLQENTKMSFFNKINNVPIRNTSKSSSGVTCQAINRQ